MNRLKDTAEAIKEIAKRHDTDMILMVTDTNVDPLLHDFLPEAPRFITKPGEDHKSVEEAERIWEFLIDRGATRHSMVVNAGGGMVTDLGGFAASTFKRGVKTVNVATTLLAAVDAAIGGKTGVNFKGLKNEIGTFWLPLDTFALPSLFNTLPEAEWLSGCGEVLKTALLSDDDLFEFASSEDFIERRDPAMVRRVVDLCADFKKRVVEEDFREGGKRKILNLGHTAGHAYESLALTVGSPVPHGVAVAHGLKKAIELSDRMFGGLRPLLDRYTRVLDKYFPTLPFGDEENSRLALLMSHDKKNRRGGKPAFVLLAGIGKPVIDVETDPF